MNNEIITEERLKEVADVKQRTKLIDWMNENRIPYKYSAKRRVFTTIDQLNKCFTSPIETNETIEFG